MISNVSWQTLMSRQTACTAQVRHLPFAGNHKWLLWQALTQESTRSLNMAAELGSLEQRVNGSLVKLWNWNHGWSWLFTWLFNDQLPRSTRLMCSKCCRLPAHVSRLDTRHDPFEATLLMALCTLFVAGNSVQPPPNSLNGLLGIPGMHWSANPCARAQAPLSVDVLLRRTILGTRRLCRSTWPE